MSRRLEDDWVESFIRYTDNTEPRETFRRWTAISTVAAVLQRKCQLNWGSETFYPNLYVVLVGPPAARKGTAIREGKKFLTEIGLLMSADEASRQKLIGTLKESIDTGQGPDGKVCLHASLTVISTELTVFLGYESRELLSMLCKWYDCEDRYQYETYTRGKEEVPNVWVNLLGATTPHQLQASLPEGAVGSGFTSRVVFVFEEDKAKMVIMPTLVVAMREDMMLDLGEIRNMYGAFHMEPAAKELYAAWREEGESRQLFTEPRLDYYIQRRPTHLFKLCMIYSAARTNERIVTLRDAQKAVATLEQAEKKMSKTFAGVGQNPLAGLQLRIAKVVHQRGKIPMSELSGMFSNDASYRYFTEAMNSVAQAGKLHHSIADGYVYKRGESDVE